MLELDMTEIESVSGGRVPISRDTSYSTAVGAAGGFLALGLTVTAPVWGTAALLGASIFASGYAVYYVLAE